MVFAAPAAKAGIPAVKARKRAAITRALGILCVSSVGGGPVLGSLPRTPMPSSGFARGFSKRRILFQNFE
jgi:hypothetical protein